MHRQLSEMSQYEGATLGQPSENENETAYTYLNDPDNMKFPDDSIDVTSDVKDMPKIMAESGHSHPNQKSTSVVADGLEEKLKKLEQTRDYLTTSAGTDNVDISNRSAVNIGEPMRRSKFLVSFMVDA